MTQILMVVWSNTSLFLIIRKRNNKSSAARFLHIFQVFRRRINLDSYPCNSLHGRHQMTTPFVPMTKEAVAAVLDCTTRTIENLVKSGGIPTPTLLAGRVFWHPDVFYSWLDSALRGGGTDGHRSDQSVGSTDDEALEVKVTGRLNSSGKSNDPVSRMKAKQAARMVLSESSD
ncbi:helix-turn-helix transcriptional regulator [Janthinobacterium sp. MDB2-8]|uniref:helix-turn-helix transcriptional regulator n=1 Tax=Janthinobacterium sp. MDB2-8 TaxID=1259338 RepID=UPI003F2787EE